VCRHRDAGHGRDRSSIGLRRLKNKRLKNKRSIPRFCGEVSEEAVVPETTGEMLAAISTRIVQLLRENYGRGPSRAKSYAMDDCIVCVLRNGFTAHERTIVDGGDPGRVIEMRQDFQRLMERQYRETIETITGRRVVAFLSQAHLEPDITLEIFFLDRPMDGSAALNLELPGADREAADDNVPGL
jgi:uncharacterized protein YbcI